MNEQILKITDSSNFQRTKSKEPQYINNSLHLPRKHARIFVPGHYLFREANSFPRANGKTVSFKLQIMSKDKYASIFSLQMEAIVSYHPSNIFHNTRGFENWGISLGYSPVLAGAYSVT